MNYYNEFDPNAAAWLRELIARNLIPAGVVDERSITDVLPTDLSGFTQYHFFAGIGGWPLAFRLAGWPDDKPAWTGSCPCQPFSDAGKGAGILDPRHLWPAWFALIRKRRPAVVFGEQVASKAALGWLDGVFDDLESEDYACGAADLCAPSVGAPHIRQRLHWVADSSRTRRIGKIENSKGDPRDEARLFVPRKSSGFGRMGDANDPRSQGYDRDGDHGNQSGRVDEKSAGPVGPAGWVTSGLGNADLCGCEPGHRTSESPRHGSSTESDGGWIDSTFILCRDGKHRRIPVEPALFPLADGLPYKLARRGSIRPALLKGAGNAIVPQEAAGFIQCYIEAKGGF